MAKVTNGTPITIENKEAKIKVTEIHGHLVIEVFQTGGTETYRTTTYQEDVLHGRLKRITPKR